MGVRSGKGVGRKKVTGETKKVGLDIKNKIEKIKNTNKKEKIKKIFFFTNLIIV